MEAGRKEFTAHPSVLAVKEPINSLPISTNLSILGAMVKF
jgi:hypothetical protein